MWPWTGKRPTSKAFHPWDMYAAYASWVQDKGLPGESLAAPHQDLAKDRYLLGSPDNVVSELKRYSGELAINKIKMMFQMQCPDIPQEQAQRQI